MHLTFCVVLGLSVAQSQRRKVTIQVSCNRRKPLLCNLFMAHLETGLETSEKVASVCTTWLHHHTLQKHLCVLIFSFLHSFSLFPQGSRELWPLQIPTTTGSMGRRVSWCFSTSLSCATAAGTGWQSRSGGTEWWRARAHHPKGRGGALSTLNFSGMKGNEWAQKEPGSCSLLVVIHYL